ncbi:hypothetical protein SDC9_80455 [bioreactor metagenome]|uniref:Uncharacterized protein n=1 Tax=bioreactor metagenome TaxID=1076179 RepID=A0A644Z702_9ZZZZ
MQQERRTRASPARYEKTPESRIKRAFLGAYVAERAARHRPGSHSSRPKRTGFAALWIVYQGFPYSGKMARRDNEALQRE